MRKIWLFMLLLTFSFGTFANEIKAGELVNFKGDGWVCRSLDKAIASKAIAESLSKGASPDIYQLDNGSCITYSVRPFKVIKYDDYLVPGYPEKGKQFVSVIEPRSGGVWHAYIGFLEKSK